MIPASTNYLKLLISILEETVTVLDDAVTEMAGCDWDIIALDTENVADLKKSHFNLVAQVQSQLRECMIKSYATMLDQAVEDVISDRNKESK